MLTPPILYTENSCGDVGVFAKFLTLFSLGENCGKKPARHLLATANPSSECDAVDLIVDGSDLAGFKKTGPYLPSAVNRDNSPKNGLPREP